MVRVPHHVKGQERKCLQDKPRMDLGDLFGKGPKKPQKPGAKPAAPPTKSKLRITSPGPEDLMAIDAAFWAARRGKGKRRARGAWFPDVQDRRVVTTLATYGVPVAAIAKAIGVRLETLHEHLGAEYEAGMMAANAKAAELLYKQFTNPSDLRIAVTAAMFWLKTRARWTEAREPDAVRPAIDPGDAARQRIEDDLNRMESRLRPIAGGTDGARDDGGTAPPAAQRSIH
jgi:hypothetical protein